MDFPKQFKPPACIVTLEQNYRSTQPILYACNLIIGFAKERFTKNLFSERRSKQKPYLTTVADEAAQDRYVAQQILQAREAGVPLKAQVARTSEEIEEELRLLHVAMTRSIDELDFYTQHATE